MWLPPWQLTSVFSCYKFLLVYQKLLVHRRASAPTGYFGVTPETLQALPE